MPKVTEEHVVERKRQILDAAFACFARGGFHATTMQDICREAGLSAGAVYTYFESKEEIIRTACAECQGRSLALLEGAAAVGDTRQVIHGMADAFFADFEAPDSDGSNRASVNLWSESVINPAVGDAYRENCGALRGALRGVVEAVQGRGDFDASLDADGVARAMVALYDGLVLQKALDPSMDTRPYVDVAKALFTGTFWTGAQTN